jgi:Fe2+ transport system protein FeoA
MAQQSVLPSELEDDVHGAHQHEVCGQEAHRQEDACRKAVGVTLPLSELAVGAHAQIARMKANPQICYLQCMGFTPGAHVEMIRRISGGALSVYRVEDADVALRREAAAMISVRMEG